MIKLYKEAGERLYLARIMRGYTREELAELAEISARFLYEIETGKKGFSAIVLYNLCNALNVECDYILSGRMKTVFDKKLSGVLQMFNENQMEQLVNILKDVYDLIN